MSDLVKRQYRSIPSELFDEFWHRDLSPMAQCVLTFLVCGPASNLFGCYRITPDIVASYLGHPPGDVMEAFEQLESQAAIFRIPGTDWIFVKEAFNWQCYGRPSAKDTKGKAAVRYYVELRKKCPEISELFFERYADEVEIDPSLRETAA